MRYRLALNHQTRRPSALISAAFEFVVPWSIAKITWPVEVAGTCSSFLRQLFHVTLRHGVDKLADLTEYAVTNE